MPEKILIISYVFPPSKGIGGRRWAKIAKHWHQQGNDVEVIAGFNKNDNGGPWDIDVTALIKKNKIHYIADDYPKIINSIPNTIIQKLQYRLALNLVKIRIKGNYYDRSVFWTEKILPLVKQKIKEGFTNIAATGAPFFYLKNIIALKDEFPGLKVWIDLRDPWTWGDGFGMGLLNHKRKRNEENTEKYVIEKADLVTVPVRKMYSELSKMYNPEGLRVLPHFYDPDDIPGKRVENPDFDHSLIYAGAVYDGIENTLLSVADELLRIKDKKIRWRFFVSNPDKLSKVFADKRYNKLIEINAQIPSADILRQIINSDFYIAIYPERFKDHLSTKFPELYALGTPIIYIGANGDVASFITQNNIGRAIVPVDIKSEFQNALKIQRVKKNPDSKKYSIKTIVGNSFSENLIKG